jgi:hypothetical protein
MSIELKIEDHLGLPAGSWEILALHTDLVYDGPFVHLLFPKLIYSDGDLYIRLGFS